MSASQASASSCPSQPPQAQGSITMPHVAPSRRQSTLDATWDPQRKEDVDRAVARFFYHDHIPFNAARSEYFKVMVKKIGEYGHLYTPPSSETLRTTLLQKERYDVEQAAENTRHLWKINGVTLIADGWSDTRKRSIHGVVAYSRGEMYFISSHDASGSGKSADALASEWAEAINFVGSELVVQFVVDGEAANRAAGVIIQVMYPHVTVSFCMAHCLNNLLKDLGKLSWIAPIIDKAHHMVTFVLNHQFLRHEFNKKSSKQLLKYSETRFAYNFLMLGRLSTCSAALRQVFISDEFTSSRLASTPAGVKCKDDAEDLEFWEDVRRIDAMVQPIMHLLRVVDGMKPCIGKVYEAMDRMIEQLKVLIQEQEQEQIDDDDDDDEDDTLKSKYELVQDLCVSRWNAYHSPLHAAAYILDPEFQGKGQEEDKEVANGWMKILEKMVPDYDTRRKIRDSLSEYRSFKGKYGCHDAQEDRTRVGAALWWEDYGSDGPELQRLARRILSQTVTSSCLEQLWSSYSHIASKKRNRLGVQRASDLVFISANLRMLAKEVIAKADPFLEWEQQQEKENAQDEVPGEMHDDGDDDDADSLDS